MPELPEVETVIRGLSQHLVGQAISEIEVQTPKSFAWSTSIPDPAVVRGLKITSLSRRGKGIIIHLTKGFCLLIHLKMTGQLIYIDKAKRVRLNSGHPDANFLAAMPSPHTRVFFSLTKGTLFFNDQRKFGYTKLTREDLLATDPFIRKLGPEPLSQEFTNDILWTTIQRRPRSTIKSILLDQSVVVGVGNIYADEALFLARILPTRTASQISKSESDQITSAIKKILALGIKHSGTSISHYKTSTGATGNMQNHLKVYARKGAPCVVCKNPIQKTRTAGRGTHFCPNCQS